MPIRFVIEDEAHAQQCGEFATFEAALVRLRQLAALPWNEHPNVVPCTSWGNCGRRYEVVEYEISWRPWQELHRTPALEINAGGVTWQHPLEERIRESSAPDTAG